MGVLENFFNPQSVAIIGASNSPGKIGHAILKNVIDSGYPGKILPVNPKEKEILGLRAYPGIKEVPEKVEMAVISVPAAGVLKVAGECGRAGVKNLVVITAGFKEVGMEGLNMEKELLATCREYGMHMLGPNCLGMMDTHMCINTSFAKVFPNKGNIAFISQSGAMQLAILDWSLTAGIGFSKVVSIGNKADLSEIDFIEEAANDPYTRVILCYIEDVADGGRFLQVVSQATRKKPVIILKSGTSQAGAQAASSHTGALAGSDIAYDTAFNQCGVIRVKSMTELFDMATAFSKCALPAGDKVAIVSNSGGPGIIATDNVENNGLTMARFNKDTLEVLRGGLPPESGIYNPVDVLGDASADRYKFALEKVCADTNTDVLMLLLCHAATTQPLETGRALLEMKRMYPEKTFFASYMGGEGLKEGVGLLTEGDIPCYTFPEPAISAISRMVDYRKYINTPLQEEGLDYPDVDKKTVKAIFYDVLKDNRLVLLGSEAAEVASAYGISAAPVALAATADEAVKEAEKIGYPVVLKVASPKILHKTDVGGVKVGLNSPGAVKDGFLEIMESVRRLMPKAVVYGVEVNKMMPRGTELIVGMSRDIQFGPMIACGLGGIYVNLLKDVSFRLARGLTRSEIEKMLAETKSYTLLRGYRGSEPQDIKAVVDTVGRVARLALDFPEITELDVNPVFVYPSGISALDVKITISMS
jgi:acetyltransferase